MQDEGGKTNVPIVIILPTLIGPIFCDVEKFMVVSRVYESMGIAMGQGGETACLPYSWMDDMELHGGRKWINKCRRNRYECGHPPISKVEGLSETAAWRENWQMTGSTEVGSTSDKWGISGGSGDINVSVTGQKQIVQGENTAMKMNSAIAGDSATGR